MAELKIKNKKTTKKCDASSKVGMLEKRVAELEKLVASLQAPGDVVPIQAQDSRVDNLIRILSSDAMKKGNGPYVQSRVLRELVK